MIFFKSRTQQSFEILYSLRFVRKPKISRIKCRDIVTSERKQLCSPVCYPSRGGQRVPQQQLEKEGEKKGVDAPPHRARTHNTRSARFACKGSDRQVENDAVALTETEVCLLVTSRLLYCYVKMRKPLILPCACTSN